MIIKSKVFSSSTCLAYHSRQNIPKTFLNPQRRHWIWAPVQQYSSDLNLPTALPELSLEHPDNLPPEKRYMLKITGPYIHKRSLTMSFHVRIKGAPDAWFAFAGSTNHWTHYPNQSCQPVWDADTKSISIFTENEHPVPGSRRYLKDLLASRNPWTGKVLVDFLIKKGYISQEELQKIPKYYQTDYDLARLQEMGFSQRASVTSGGQSRRYPRLPFCPRFQSPDHTLKLRDAHGGTPENRIALDSSENCLIGHDIRIIPHIITSVESGPRLGIHLDEVVGHPKPDFTAVNRPLMLNYRSRGAQFKKKVGVNPAESRPLEDRYFPHGKYFVDFVEMVNKHRQQSLT